MNYSVEDAITRFKTVIADKTNWTALQKSQFVNLAAIFLSYAQRDALWQVERALQESFPSTAINFSSLKAHMESIGYLPRKPQPSTGEISIHNGSGSLLEIDANQALASNKGTKYLIPSSQSIADGATQTGVSITQIELSEQSYIVSKESPFYEILLPLDSTDRIHDFSVYVDELADGSEDLYAYAMGFRNVSAGEKVYDEFFKHTGQVGIRFGNDSFGTVLPVGAVVRVVMELTSGETSLIEGQKLYPVGASMPNVTFTVTTAITGGQPQESMEESRANMQYWPIYQQEMVWREDYLFFLKRNVSGIVWIKAWGEEEHEAAYGADAGNINTLFFSGYSDTKSDATLETDVTDALSSVLPMNCKVSWMTPNTAAFTITVSGVVSGKLNPSEVAQEIKAALESAYGINSATRPDSIREKNVYKEIENTGHFDDPLSYFSLTIDTGSLTPTNPDDMVYLDADNSTFSILKR